MHPAPHGGYARPMQAAPPPRMSDPDRGRRAVGCGCYTLGMFGGAGLLFLLFVLFPALSVGIPMFEAMCVGAGLAFPMMVVYLIIPRALDRYDPEPWYALLMALAWGGVAACGFSALVNTSVGAMIGGSLGDVVSTVISAPIVEEASKGILILGYFYFLRREFDGVVDGIIYASFVAIGFAAVENVIYYAQAGLEGGVIVTFIIRGVLSPWGHPLYTAMTGIGVGVARETTKPWLRFVAPIAGYCAAVILHATWNGAAVLAGALGVAGVLLLVLMLLLWFVFFVAFILIVGVLVHRRGKIIRAHLIDEVALGHLSKAELELVVSLFGGVTAYFRRGKKGVEFVRAVARLALSKWHSARAMKEVKHTMSMDFVIPLRRKIKDLRAQGASPA